MTLARTTLLILAALAWAQPAAAAQIYKCKNEKGEIYYAQAYDPARCGGGGAQLNEQGLAVRTIERRKTAEELAAEKAQAEAEAEARRKLEADRQADQVLLMSYASADDLKRAHQEQLDVIDQAIATARIQAESQQKSLAELLASAAESERAGKPIPDAVTKSIANVRGTIEQQHAVAAKREAERAAATAEFEARLKRYETLKARNQAPR
jgi:hypothetical protein